MNQSIYHDKNRIAAEIRRSMYFRYLLTGIAVGFFSLFRTRLPYPFPHLLILSSAFLIISALIHCLSLNKRLLPTIHSLLPYFDTSIAPFVFHFTGGFLSPFIVLHMMTFMSSGSKYSYNRSSSDHLGSFLFFSYIFVALLHKFGILFNAVDYSRTMMNSTVFFYFILLSV